MPRLIAKRERTQIRMFVGAAGVLLCWLLNLDSVLQAQPYQAAAGDWNGYRSSGSNALEPTRRSTPMVAPAGFYTEAMVGGIGGAGNMPAPANNSATGPRHQPQTTYSPQAWAQHNPCTHPSATAPLTRFDLPGLQGRPYRDGITGGCDCSNPRGVTRCTNASIYWSAPGSAMFQQRFPTADCWWESAGRQQFFAPLDRLGDFSGVPFRRQDSGYCGPSADPYGCLSASRQQAYGVR